MDRTLKLQCLLLDNTTSLSHEDFSLPVQKQIHIDLLTTFRPFLFGSSIVQIVRPRLVKFKHVFRLPYSNFLMVIVEGIRAHNFKDQPQAVAKTVRAASYFHRILAKRTVFHCFMSTRARLISYHTKEIGTVRLK